MTGLVEPAFNGSARTAAFVFMIGFFVGGFVLSMQALAGRNWVAAVRRFTLGGGLGAGAALVAMPLADASVRGAGGGAKGRKNLRGRPVPRPPASGAARIGRMVEGAGIRVA